MHRKYKKQITNNSELIIDILSFYGNPFQLDDKHQLRQEYYLRIDEDEGYENVTYEYDDQFANILNISLDRYHEITAKHNGKFFQSYGKTLYKSINDAKSAFDEITNCLAIYKITNTEIGDALYNKFVKQNRDKLDESFYNYYLNTDGEYLTYDERLKLNL